MSDQSLQEEDAQEQTLIRNYGLTTKEALVRLHKDVESEIERMECEFSNRRFLSWLKESISFKSELSKMRWPSVLFMTAQVLAHLIVAFILNIDNAATNWIGFQGLILMGLLVFNLAVNAWDTRLRSKELLMKSKQILYIIRKCSSDKDLLRHWAKSGWKSTHVKSLFAPKSPCVHQTLTYRDESCVNLPDFLLVKGDIVHIYPGERAPGDCMSLRPVKKSDNPITVANDKIFLKEGQIFHDDNSGYSHTLRDGAPNQDISDDGHTHYSSRLMQDNHARLKRANKGTDFLMVTTPYINSLRISLQLSHKRPVNSVEKECFIISRKYFETFVIPSVFVLSTIITAIHYGYLDLTDSDQKIKTISIAYLLLRPSLTIMPFLPWMFPCFWLVVNGYGSARLFCCGEVQRKSGKKILEKHREQSAGYSPEWDSRHPVPSKFENLLATPTAAGSSENKMDEDLHELRSHVKFNSIFKMFISLVKGDSGHVWRSSSLLQVLGCLTSLCCIDKVGILSWSNPTPEKVSVIAKDQEITLTDYHPAQQNTLADIDVAATDDTSDQEEALLDRGDTAMGHEGIDRGDDFKQTVRVMNSIGPANQTSDARLEVLDVSHSHHNFHSSMPLMQPGRLQFDDLAWRKFLTNLKPIGLGILMNNCYEASFGDYFRFYKHISHESILRCNITPVVKRRCMCALSRLIGFSRDAVMNYKYINQIGIYRLINPSSIKKGKLVPSLENTSRLKLPFPNMTCNVYQDITTGGYQMFSQGTADIILDACVEYWDGRRLCPLDDGLRKRIMDFYHRTSLTSYCSAFSYSPLLDKHKLGSYCIELPQQTSKFSLTMRKLINEQHENFLQNQTINLSKNGGHMLIALDGSRFTSIDNDIYGSDAAAPMDQFTSLHADMDNMAPRTMTRRHLSVENLDEKNDSTRSKVRVSGEQKTSGRLDETLDEVSDQVFVGMVTLQYQACGDFVTLIEQLEHACIRFVHFSRENELRSRVFSEKLGLESGWNCHISLQSDQDLDRNERLPERQNQEDNVPEDFAQLDLSALSQTNRVFDLLEGSIDDETVACNDDVKSIDERTLHSWKSLPSLVAKLTARLAPKITDISRNQADCRMQKNSLGLNPSNTTTECLLDGTVPVSDLDEEPKTDANQVEAAEENEALDTLAFDMANRAKLPKGIENIRPHLETVDNIPLQVSLFTDCTPELTKEMIEIMQDYGEIVCVIGSSSSRLNTSIFLQANASVAIEPLMPQSCIDSEKKDTRRKHLRVKVKRRKKSSKKSKAQDGAASNQPGSISINMQPGRLSNPRDRLGIGPVEVPRAKPVTANLSSSSSSSSQSSSSSSTSTTSTPRASNTSSSSCSSSSDSENDDLNETVDEPKDTDLLEELPDPSSLASKLASLPCSYSYSRKDPVNLYSLILEARHFTFKMKNTFVCMICFALSISSAQFLASLLFLPPMLSAGLTIWLTVVVVPFMSFSLMSTTIDSQVMKIAVGKNLQLKPENITFFVVCYLIKFIPSIIVVVASFGLIIAHSCKLTGFGSSSLGPCWMFTYVQHGNATSPGSIDEDLVWSTHLLTAQVCAAFLLVLYFVVISAGFVHRSHLMWQKSPTKNTIWVIISLVSILGQLVYNHLVLQFNLSSTKMSYEFLASLPLHIWIITSISPILVTGINLLVKRAEIKAIIRQQRRARFDFATKLGMNSPF